MDSLGQGSDGAADGGGPIGAALGRRGTREGERRTSLIQVKSREENADGAVDGGGKPQFDRTQSYNKEDLKRVMSERLMGAVDGKEENTGYSSEVSGKDV
jgi:hypothetical protein